MFDVGFSEILVIAVVALIVIGPERLPKVARTMGHLWGRVQRYVSGVKADISREMNLEEMRKAQQEIQQQAETTTQALNLVEQELDKDMQQLAAQVEQPLINQSPVKHYSSITMKSQEASQEASPQEEVKPAPVRVPQQQTFPID